MSHPAQPPVFAALQQLVQLERQRLNLDYQFGNQLAEEMAEQVLFHKILKLDHHPDLSSEQRQEAFQQSLSDLKVQLQSTEGRRTRQYLIRTIRNAFLDLIKCRDTGVRRQSLSLDALEDDPTATMTNKTLPHHPSREQSGHLESAVDLAKRSFELFHRLPREDRHLLSLYHLHGYGLIEAATLASLSKSTVQRRLKGIAKTIETIFASDPAFHLSETDRDEVIHGFVELLNKETASD